MLSRASIIEILLCLNIAIDHGIEYEIAEQVHGLSRAGTPERHHTGVCAAILAVPCTSHRETGTVSAGSPEGL